MSFSIIYKELFNVKILHHYFLDKGKKKFSSMSEEEQLKQLNNYDISSAINIVPTTRTLQKLMGHKLIFKTTGTGITVWSKVSDIDDKEPFIGLNENLFFTFLIKVNDAVFYNYTDLKFESTGKPYYISNRALESEPNNFPLIDKAGGNRYVNDNFVQSAKFDERDGLEKLTINEKLNMLGLIRIFMKGAESSLSVITTQGKLRVSPREFEMVFKNRYTFWRYIFDQNQTVSTSDYLKIENGDAKRLVTKIEYPLTQKGFISIGLGGKELPNPNVKDTFSDSSSNYYSEIYM